MSSWVTSFTGFIPKGYSSVRCIITWSELQTLLWKVEGNIIIQHHSLKECRPLVFFQKLCSWQKPKGILNTHLSTHALKAEAPTHWPASHTRAQAHRKRLHRSEWYILWNSSVLNIEHRLSSSTIQGRPCSLLNYTTDLSQWKEPTRKTITRPRPAKGEQWTSINRANCSGTAQGWQQMTQRCWPTSRISDQESYTACTRRNLDHRSPTKQHTLLRWSAAVWIILLFTWRLQIFWTASLV